MAVGKTGSFATVQPAGFDVAGMMRGAQQEQSRINRQKLSMDEAVARDKSELLASLQAPEAESTGEYNTDTFIYKGVDLMKDKLYEAQKQMQSGNLSRSEMQGMASAFNRELGQFTQDVQFLSEGASSFLAKVESGDISEGLSDSSTLVMDRLLQGKIDDVKVNNNGKVLAVIDGEEYDISKIRQSLENPPQSARVGEKVKAFADEFKSRVDKTFENMGYDTIEVKEMTDNQLLEVEELAKSLALDPKYTNDIWFQTYKEKDKMTLTEEEAEQLAEDFSEIMTRDVRNRMDEYLKKDRDAKGVDARQKRLEEKETITKTGNMVLELSPAYNQELLSLDEKDIPSISEAIKNGDPRALELTTITDGSLSIPFMKMTSPAIEKGGSFSKIEGSESDFSNVIINGFKYDEKTGNLFITGRTKQTQKAISESLSTDIDRDSRFRSSESEKEKEKDVKISGVVTGEAANELVYKLEQAKLIEKNKNQTIQGGNIR